MSTGAPAYLPMALLRRGDWSPWACFVALCRVSQSSKYPCHGYTILGRWELSVIPSSLFLGRKNSSLFCSFLGIPCNDRTFKCGNDICFRKQNAQCDGTVDCPDGSDEEGCSEYIPSGSLYSFLGFHAFIFIPFLEYIPSWGPGKNNKYRRTASEMVSQN